MYSCAASESKTIVSRRMIFSRIKYIFTLVKIKCCTQTSFCEKGRELAQTGIYRLIYKMIYEMDNEEFQSNK